MAQHDKRIRVANFNITFDPNCEPLLTHFSDYVFPALKSKIKRKTSSATFYFDNIKVKRISNRYVLSGDLIKDTQYRVRSIVEKGELIETSNLVPTAPYSHFVVLLDSHRMVLVKNEGLSPDIKTFQKTLAHVLSAFRKKRDDVENTLASPVELPMALVNIVELVQNDDLHKALVEFEKIDALKLKFFPLNNDFDSSELFSSIRSTMDNMESPKSELTISRPGSSEQVEDLASDALKNGTISATIEGKREDGSKIRIKDNEFKADHTMKFDGNVTEIDDAYIIKTMSDRDTIPKASKENYSLYEKTVDLLQSLMES